MTQVYQEILQSISLVHQRQAEVEAQIQRIQALLQAADAQPDSAEDAASDVPPSPPVEEEGTIPVQEPLQEQLERLNEQLDRLKKQSDRNSSQKERRENQLKGFLSGVVMAWFLVALGTLAILLGQKMLTWFAEALGLTAPILLSFLLLFLLALLVQEKAKDIVFLILDLLFSDSDDEEDYEDE